MNAPYPFANASAARVHVLHPGDVVCAERGDRLETLLGSCVAVILTDRARTIAAMCHAVHTGVSSHASARPTAAADVAIDHMYELIAARGLNPTLCEAFVYGGGNMFPGVVRDGHVGETNTTRALERLAEDGVRVPLSIVGGIAYRRVRWTIGPGLPEVVAVDVEDER